MFRWLTALVALLLPAATLAATGPIRLTPHIVSCPQGHSAPEWRCLAMAPAAADALPAHWSLLVDRVRFDAIEVEAIGKDGLIERQIVAQDALGRNWSMGGNLRFDIAAPPASLRSIRLSYRNIDDIGFVRSFKAVSPAGLAAFEEEWRTLVTFVVGVLVCSLLYNLFLRDWSATQFRVWYVLWLLGGINYTLIWSGYAFSVYPILAGNLGLAICNLLVGWMVGAATLFLLTLVEPGLVGPRLLRLSRIAAGGIAVAAVIAGPRWPVPPAASDGALNVSLAVCAVLGLTVAVQALRKGSRAIVFYLVGWLPAFTIVAMRVARNLGLMGQADWIDMATFGTMAFEAMMLSLAIADRYRTLERQNQQGEIEREALQRAANTDPLTGLANRAAFNAAMDRMEHESQVADLVLADLDQLKDTNDALGHCAGDGLIREAGLRLAVAAGAGALVARIGGDEFAVLLLDEQRTRLPLVFALFASADGANAGDETPTPKMSAGHVTWRRGLAPATQLYRDADLALYRAKADHRGACRSFDAVMRDEDNARARLLIEAQAGILRQEFKLLYQPIIDLGSRQVISHEAMLRWSHPSRGSLFPADFASVLNDPGTAVLLQARILEMALETIASDRRTMNSVSIELPANQLARAAAADVILGRLAHYGLPPEVLIVEIIDANALGNRRTSIFAGLDRLRSAGIRIAFSNFGLSFAPLVHLAEMPGDIIKIDRKLVNGAPAIAESAALVRAIIGLAHSLGKVVIAEGVDTDAQLRFLKSCDCDAGQGLLFDGPARGDVSVTLRAAS